MGFCFPGSFSIQGPETVKGPEWGSVTVQCQYDPGWETYRKWWCRGTRWNTCRILIQTQGTEEEVLGDRVAIRDDQRHRLLSVTMWQLRRNDMDIYWCGIQRTGVDLGFRVQVIIDPGKNSLVCTARPWCSGLEERGGLFPPPHGQRGQTDGQEGRERNRRAAAAQPSCPAHP